MFSSIKYRFITIYFILVLISMAIVGSFVINRLQNEQIKNIEENMLNTLDTIMATSTYNSDDSPDFENSQIKNTLREWRLSPGQSIYALSPEESPLIIASSGKMQRTEGMNALSLNFLEPSLILKAIGGDFADATTAKAEGVLNEKHICKPIFSPDGDVKGLLYMTSDLSSVENLVRDTKIILTYSTFIALAITTLLGYIIAISITEPIRDVTKKASQMAKGDFNQRVEVKSDDEIGNLGSMFNFLTDELKTTINEMNLEKSKLNIIFDYMAEGLIAVDRNNFLIHANPIARNILNIPDDYTTIKQNLNDLNIFNINYYDSLSLKGESSLELDKKFYKIKYAPYKRDKLANLGLIIVLQDITKEHELDILRKEFVANVSHELKTPITTIGSYSETILESNLDSSRIKNFVSIISRENNRMARLVSDLLQLSNIDHRSSSFVYEEIDTYDIISQTIESLDVLIKQKKHNIKLDIPMDIKNIYADRHALDQILMNVFSNAMKYTNDGGTIKISVLSKNFEIKIVIEDNGIGIPAEDLPRIFERFYRVEKGRSRAMGGTGLGLSIARELALNMGGDIEIESVFNEGTKVSLSLKTV